MGSTDFSYGAYVASLSVREANLSFIALIRSEYVLTFVLSDTAMSSRYEMYDSMSFSIASIVTGRWVCRHGPRVQNISSFPLLVISYFPSARRVSSPSSTMLSSSGYTDPGEGRHQPMLAFSTSPIISAPFFGPASSMERIHGRSQPLLLIPNMFYRLFDIEYTI